MDSSFGRYELQERIGAGGMAEVFRAIHHDRNNRPRVVVVKRILPEHARDPQFVEMFMDEARICTNLLHPNIVEVLDFGQSQGHYFLATEYIYGRDLRTLLIELNRQHDTKIPMQVVYYIGSCIASGLAYIHDATDERQQPLNIVHRDLTPSNILLDFTGVVKVTDFGVAKAENRITQTDEGGLKGKTAYLPPEVLHGQAVTQLADVWSLGVMLYEMAAGEHPYGNDVLRAPLLAAQRITRQKPPRIPHARQVPQAFDVLVRRMMRKDPTMRTQHLKPVAHELSELAGADAKNATARFLRFVFDVTDVSMVAPSIGANRDDEPTASREVEPDTAEYAAPAPGPVTEEISAVTAPRRPVTPHALPDTRSDTTVESDRPTAPRAPVHPPETPGPEPAPESQWPSLWQSLGMRVGGLLLLVAGVFALGIAIGRMSNQQSSTLTGSPTALVTIPRTSTPPRTTPTPNRIVSTPRATEQVTPKSTPSRAQRREKAVAYLNAAKLARSRGESDESLRYVERAIQADRSYGEAWCTWALWIGPGHARFPNARDGCYKYGSDSQLHGIVKAMDSSL